MSKSKSRKNRRKNVQRTRTIETLEKREMFSTAPWGGQVEIELAVEPPTAVVASNPSEQVAVSFGDDGILNVVGTQEDDSIHVRENRHGQVIVESDGDKIFRTQRGTKVQQLRIDGHDGDDHIRNDTSLPSIITGGDGRDRLIGGSGDDVLLGQKGRDRLNGRRGNDILIGGKGEDKLNGGPGRDSIDNKSPLSVLPGLSHNVTPLPKPSVTLEDSDKIEKSKNEIVGEKTTEDTKKDKAKTSKSQIAGGGSIFGAKKSTFARPDGVYHVDYKQTLRITVAELLKNDSGADLRIEEGTFDTEEGGRVTIRNGYVWFVQGNDKAHRDSFEYEVKGAGQTARGKAKVSFQIENIPPTAKDDFGDGFIVYQNRDRSWYLKEILSNDRDPDGNRSKLKVKSVRSTTGTHGTVELHDDRIIYTPETGYLGKATFLYTIEDESGHRDSASVTVNVQIIPSVGGPGGSPSGPSNKPDNGEGDQEDNTPADPHERPTYTINGGHLVVQGTEKNDYIAVQESNGRLYIGITSFDAQGTKLFTREDLGSILGFKSVTLYGEEGNDTLSNYSSLPTTIYGGEGADRLTGGNGNDFIDGGAGHDQIDGSNGNNQLFGGSGDDSLRGGNGNDLLHGGEGHDRLTDSFGTNTLNGGNGHDDLQGGRGVDHLIGGAGNDRISGGWSTGDTLEGNAGNDTLFAPRGGGAVYGGDGNDHITGSSVNDRLFGENGNDIIKGGAGVDHIDGGAGNDDIDGGDGTDYLYGGLGNDLIKGGAGKDRLYGGDGDDHLLGQKGADQLRGEAGNDSLTGGAGNDHLLGGVGNDHLLGNDGNDRLNGESGTDTLRGGKGDDHLIALDGAFDSLYGGLGDDRFRVAKKRVIKSR